MIVNLHLVVSTAFCECITVACHKFFPMCLLVHSTKNLPHEMCLLCHLLPQSVLDGYNGTVMAYGQTGTGKTYTLGRLGEEDAADRGIMVRAMEDILAEISPDCVCVSYSQVIPSQD